MLLETFNQPHNLPIPEFAKLADKGGSVSAVELLQRLELELAAKPGNGRAMGF